MTTDRVELSGGLSLTSVVAFGLAYMAPSLVMVIFGVIAAASGGTAPTAFLVATGAMFLTALSYAKMARHFPVSGSAYFYARKVIGAPVGFLVGWVVLLDYLFLPMVAWLVQSVYLNAQFPAVPVWVWMLVNAGLTTLVNIIGLSLTDRVNKLLTGVTVFLVLLFVAYCLVHLGHHPAKSYTMSVQVGGQTFADWTNMAGIVAGFASGLAVQLSSSRLMYIMGRDGVLPRFLGTLHPRTRTPVFCLLVTGAMCLLGPGLSLETATSFINFGAFLAFTVVNACVVVHFVRNRGTGGVGVLGHVVAPVLGAGVTVYLLTQLSTAALTVGGCWLAIGFCCLLRLTRGFRRPTPELGIGDGPSEEARALPGDEAVRA
ncbi:APC family permease [Streptomyces sp. NPDC002403]